VPEPTTLQLALLVSTAFAGGVVDAVAGGGGLITVPALLAVGLPPQLAIGTNKGQAVFGVATALARFARAGLVDGARARIAFPCGLVGAVAGAAVVTAMSPQLLRPIVLALLVGAAAFVAFRPRRPRETARVPPRLVPAATAGIALVLGAYDGFFGPGAGTFLVVAFASLLGDSLQRASAEAKVVNFASCFAGVVVFAAKGFVAWKLALPMAVAQVAGAFLGAHLTVRRGDVVVRRVVLLVVVALVVKLARDLWSP
jgi:hypothetical protein